MGSGAQYVVTGGTIEMQLLYANSWDMMDVSGDCFNTCLMLIPQLVSHAILRESEFGSLLSPRSNSISYHCNGTEKNLTECDHSEYLFHDCTGRISAGVICTSMHKIYQQVKQKYYIFVDEVCDEGEVHLVGGDGVSRGRVEYCHNGTWYSVCADGWNTTGDEARVICNAMGYNSSYYGMTIPYVLLRFFPALHQVQC